MKRTTLGKLVLGGAIVSSSAYVVADQVEDIRQYQQTSDNVRRRIAGLGTPAEIECRRETLTTGRTTCDVNFRNQQVRPDLQACQVRIDCPSEGLGENCLTTVAGANSRCAGVLGESTAPAARGRI